MLYPEYAPGIMNIFQTDWTELPFQDDVNGQLFFFFIITSV